MTKIKTNVCRKHTASCGSQTVTICICGLVCLFAVIYKTYINKVLYNIQNKQSK